MLRGIEVCVGQDELREISAGYVREFLAKRKEFNQVFHDFILQDILMDEIKSTEVKKLIYQITNTK